MTSRSLFLLVGGCSLAITLAGCGRKEAESHAHEAGEKPHAREAGVTFSAKNGLLVPTATAKFIGLEIADVTERKLAATFQFSAQVYRAASEAQFASLQTSGGASALASGSISAADAAKLSDGQTVSVRAQNSAVPLQGYIVALKHDLEKASGEVEVLLSIPDAQRSLLSGAFVSVSVSQGGEKNVVSVPRSALFRTTEGDFVYTVSGEHYVRTPVKLGAIDPQFAEITDGLYAGDRIVITPVMTLWLAELQSIRGGKACADGH